MMNLNDIYYQRLNDLEKHFEAVQPSVSLGHMFTIQDYTNIYDIASSIKYSGEIKLKQQYLDNIMHNRGLARFGCGTNRMVYKAIEAPDILVKVPYAYSGLTDNVNEFKNQHKIKPACAKIFEVSHNGMVSLVERGKPIMTIQEFNNYAESIFDALNDLTQRYMMTDVGGWFFMNWGVFDNIRIGLLDFPYVYPYERQKMICKNINKHLGMVEECGGVIKYDPGFNNFYCNRCNKMYSLTDIGYKAEEQHDIKKLNTINSIKEISMEKVILKKVSNGEVIKISEVTPVEKLDEGVAAIDLTKIEQAPHKFETKEDVLVESNGSRIIKRTHIPTEEYKIFSKKQREETGMRKVFIVDESNKTKTISEDEHNKRVQQGEEAREGIKKVNMTIQDTITPPELNKQENVTITPKKNEVIDNGETVTIRKRFVVSEENAIHEMIKNIDPNTKVVANCPTTNVQHSGYEFKAIEDTMIDEQETTLPIIDDAQIFQKEEDREVQLVEDHDDIAFTNEGMPVDVDENATVEDIVNAQIRAANENLQARAAFIQMEEMAEMANNPNSILIENMKKEERRETERTQ